MGDGRWKCWGRLGESEHPAIHHSPQATSVTLRPSVLGSSSLPPTRLNGLGVPETGFAKASTPKGRIALSAVLKFNGSTGPSSLPTLALLPYTYHYAIRAV